MLRPRLFLVAATLLIAPLTVPACRPPALTDSEKRLRIDEMYREYRPALAGVPEVTADRLREWIDAGEVVVVDVRPENERQVSTIRGAVPVEAWEADPGSFPDRKIVYCTIGYRSGLYAGELRRRGQEVYNLKGGILAWTHVHGPLSDARGETRRVHVYGKSWNLVAAGYEAVW